MAFQKKTWVNRVVQYPLRRLLTMVRPDDGSGTEIVDIQREDGEITTEGDAFSAENMNDLEGRIEEAFNNIDIPVDDELDLTSENPVQNKVITTRVNSVSSVANSASSTASSALSTAQSASSTASSAYSIASRADDMIWKSQDQYSETSSYSVGDLVIRSNTLYRCKTACSAGSWATNQSCFEQTTLTKAITALNQNLNATVESWRVGNKVKIGNIMFLETKISLPAVGAGSWSTATLTYPEAFAYMPACSVSFIGSLYNTNALSPVIVSESETGATVGVYQPATAVDIRFIAIGVSA